MESHEDESGAGDVTPTSHLKRTCEECTKSKVRCSGPESGTCERCEQRKTPCVFRNKFKRGPPPSSTHKVRRNQPAVSKRRMDKADGSVSSSRTMSWHERRCWNVLFTIFKHQAVYDSPVSWCWFALQIDKLRRDLNRKHQVAAMQQLEAFMERLHTKMSALEQQMSKQCSFAPHLCAGCSAAAMIGPKPNQSRYLRPADETGQALFQAGNRPAIEFSLDADGGHIATVNDAFVRAFGHTKESLTADLAWSGGGGLLTWGGDLMARLLWSEADVLIFLQVLAVKFQSLGAPRHDHDNPTSVHTRDVLSAYIFDVRVAGPRHWEEMVVPCIVKSLHREILQGQKLSVTVLLEFDMLGMPKKGSELPESSKEALERNRRDSSIAPVAPSAIMEQHQVPQETANVPPRLPLQPRQESVSSFQPRPEDDIALLDPTWDWRTFETVVNTSTATTTVGEDVAQPGAIVRTPSEGATSHEHHSSELGEDDDEGDDDSDEQHQAFGGFNPNSDEAWLASLIDWTQ